MPTLDGALALAEREHVPVAVGKHLHLDVAGRNECLLDVDSAVAERREGLDGRRRERLLQLGRGGDEPHAFSAAARRRLQQHGIAEVVCGGACVGGTRHAVCAGDDRDSGLLHRRLRPHLVPHLFHDFRARADEGEVALGARTHERRVLREEAVAGMNRLAAGCLRGADH